MHNSVYRNANEVAPDSSQAVATSLKEPEGFLVSTVDSNLLSPRTLDRSGTFHLEKGPARRSRPGRLSLETGSGARFNAWLRATLG